jgi:hypothetical protein
MTRLPVGRRASGFVQVAKWRSICSAESVNLRVYQEFGL